MPASLLGPVCAVEDCDRPPEFSIDLLLRPTRLCEELARVPVRVPTPLVACLPHAALAERDGPLALYGDRDVLGAAVALLVAGRRSYGVAIPFSVDPDRTLVGSRRLDG